MVLHRAGPHAGGVGVLAVLQVVAVLVGQLQQRLCAVLPVDQILGLNDGCSGEVVHRRRHHIIGVINANHVGIGEVGEDDGVAVLARAQVAHGEVLEVGMCPVFGVVVCIPLHTSLSAGLGVTAESRNNLAFLDKGVNLQEVVRVSQSHGDVAVVVESGLERLAPLGCRTSGPGAHVLEHRVAVLVEFVKLLRLLLRAPIDLADENRVGLHHRHGLAEVADLVRRVTVGIAAVVPTAVVMHSIADIVTFDGVGSIASIVGLIAGSWHPDDAREAILADFVHNGLEIVVQSLRVILIVGVADVDGLVGQLNHDLSGVFLYVGVLGDYVPDFQQILLIVVAHLQVRGAYSRRAHHDILSVVHGLLHQGEVKVAEIGLQSGGVELRDVSLAAYASGLVGSNRVFVVARRVVGPGWLQVQTEDGAMGLLESGEHLLKVVETALTAGVVVAPAPASAVEPSAGCVHYAVQHDVISVGVHQPLAFDVQRRQRLGHLCPGYGGQNCDRRQK